MKDSRGISWVKRNRGSYSPARFKGPLSITVSVRSCLEEWSNIFQVFCGPPLPPPPMCKCKVTVSAFAGSSTPIASLACCWVSALMPSITHAQFDRMIGANGESASERTYRYRTNSSVSSQLRARFLIRHRHSFGRFNCAEGRKGDGGTLPLGTPLPRAFSIKPYKYPHLPAPTPQPN